MFKNSFFRACPTNIERINQIIVYLQQIDSLPVVILCPNFQSYIIIHREDSCDSLIFHTRFSYFQDYRPQSKNWEPEVHKTATVNKHIVCEKRPMMYLLVSVFCRNKTGLNNRGVQKTRVSKKLGPGRIFVPNSLTKEIV